MHGRYVRAACIIMVGCVCFFAAFYANNVAIAVAWAMFWHILLILIVPTRG